MTGISGANACKMFIAMPGVQLVLQEFQQKLTGFREELGGIHRQLEPGQKLAISEPSHASSGIWGMSRVRGMCPKPSGWC